VKVGRPSKLSHSVGAGCGYEATDPDYVDKQAAKLAKDYMDCPLEWRRTFMSGLPKWQVRALEQRLGRRLD